LVASSATQDHSGWLGKVEKQLLDFAAPVWNQIPRSVSSADVMCSFQDGLVAGTTAEIALQSLKDCFLIRMLYGGEKSKHTHHEARSAISALGSMEIQHSLLDGMQPFGSAQAFDGDQMSAMQFGRRVKAGIDRFVHDAAFFRIGYHNRTSATIAFVAATLGAIEVFCFIQVIQGALSGGDGIVLLGTIQIIPDLVLVAYQGFPNLLLFHKTCLIL